MQSSPGACNGVESIHSVLCKVLGFFDPETTGTRSTPSTPSKSGKLREQSPRLEAAFYWQVRDRLCEALLSTLGALSFRLLNLRQKPTTHSVDHGEAAPPREGSSDTGPVLKDAARLFVFLLLSAEQQMLLDTLNSPNPTPASQPLTPRLPPGACSLSFGATSAYRLTRLLSLLLQLNPLVFTFPYPHSFVTRI